MLTSMTVKKRFSILLMALVLVSCTAQKKYNYYFSYYDYNKKTHGNAVIPAAEMKSNMPSANQSDALMRRQELTNNITPAIQGENQLKRQHRLNQPTVEKVINPETKNSGEPIVEAKKVINQEAKDSGKETVEAEKVKPVKTKRRRVIQ